VVLAALQLLKRQNRRVLVLATGATQDNRQPGAFSSLMRFAEECGVLDRFRVLGVISTQDLSGLMHHAVALINPSLFEGWSTSVEESKSMGKTILLSDIPVHREQAPERGIYFPANDAERLAEALWVAQRDFDADSDARHRAAAGSQLSSRRLQFARDFQRIIVSAAR
jgi:glycosyltransferase involved in cell wall biosynthesis